MLLRTRLLFATLAVVLVTLLAAGAGIYVAFATAVRNDIDQSLREVPLLIGDDADDDSSTPQPVPAVTPFVQVRAATGAVLLTVPARLPGGASASPALPERIPTPGVADTADGPASFFTVSDVGGQGVTFRVKAATRSDGEQLIIALPIDDKLATLRQLAVIEVAVATVATLVAAALAWWLVGLGLRPLGALTDQIKRLRGAGSGDRISVPAAPTTEVGGVAAAMNTLLDDVDTAFDERAATEDRLRQFVADASHELRTPLAAVSAYAQLFDLGASADPDGLARSMAGIQRESTRMAALADDLLLLAALDDAPGRPVPESTVNVSDVVLDAVASARVVQPGRPISADVAPGLTVVAPGEAHVRRVVDNLLANVRRHTPPQTPVDVTLTAAADACQLTVVDHGPGVPEADLHRMFNRFWRADNARSRHLGGNGLGLSIVASSVAAMSGEVTARTTPGGGLTMAVQLPLAKPSG